MPSSYSLLGLIVHKDVRSFKPSKGKITTVVMITWHFSNVSATSHAYHKSSRNKLAFSRSRQNKGVIFPHFPRHIVLRGLSREQCSYQQLSVCFSSFDFHRLNIKKASLPSTMKPVRACILKINCIGASWEVITWLWNFLSFKAVFKMRKKSCVTFIGDSKLFCK